MAVGDWHEFSDGVRFRETLHGPCVERECVDCAATCYGTPEWSKPRCSACGRRAWNLATTAPTRSLVRQPCEQVGV